jgi:hypothetical protein
VAFGSWDEKPYRRRLVSVVRPSTLVGREEKIIHISHCASLWSSFHHLETEFSLVEVIFS